MSFGKVICILENSKEAGFKRQVEIQFIENHPFPYYCREWAVGGLNNYSKSLQALKRRIMDEGSLERGVRAKWKKL